MVERGMADAWGSVSSVAGPPWWLPRDPSGMAIEPAREYLLALATRCRPLSVRSYAFGLLRWWRWLEQLSRPWHAASPRDGRDFVLMLQQARKPRRHPRTRSAATAGTVNAATRKPNLGDGYSVATVRHAVTVVHGFYQFWIDQGQGPLLNPMPRRSVRPNAHHNPLQEFKADGLRYSPRLPRRHPRSLADEQWTDLFTVLSSDRDRALLCLAVGNGVRAGEILGLRQLDIDWGDQLIRVVRKASRAEQWLPASPEALAWTRLYLASVPAIPHDVPIWSTTRRYRTASAQRAEPRTMTYEALRGVFRRANHKLGTNWTMHDVRHTAALRMSRDPNLTIRDVQTILGHRDVTTTAGIYLYEDEITVARRVLLHLTQPHASSVESPTGPMTLRYRRDDLDLLFGKGDR